MKLQILAIKSKGFALPTVMIVSIVMLMVLLSGLVAASGTNTALKEQYNAKILRQAADAGMAMANACLAKSYFNVTWSDTKPLMPNTDCDGNVVAGSSPYIVDTSATNVAGVRTTFQVKNISIENGTQRADVTAIFQRVRSSGGVSETRTVSTSAIIGSQNSFGKVTFGYRGGTGADAGAQFAVVLGTGEVKTVGKNYDGRLGNGTTVDGSTPGTFILPSSERGIAAFSNFLSVGRQISVVTMNGKMYSAGYNSSGQLGNGTTAAAVSTPVQFGTLGNSGMPKARFAAMNNYATYVIADDNKVYAAGDCTAYGIIGNGCTNTLTTAPVLVSLPAPTSDPNTQPEVANDWTQSTNFITDRLTTYVRMKGGAVYGWGANDWGHLGDGTFTSRTTPIQIKALTSSQTPVAKQIAFNGNSLYIIDADGLVWATGENATYGELGGTGSIIQNGGNTGLCLAKDSATTRLMAPGCSYGIGWQWLELWPDNTIRLRANSGSFRPTDPMNCATAPATIGSTSYIEMLPCSGAANQKWTVGSDKTIKSQSLNACIEVNTEVYVFTCAPSNTYQQWSVRNSPYLRPMPVPPGNPKALRLSTDNGGIVVLYDNGEVWAAGGNNRNQLGIGTAYMSQYNPVLRKVSLPSQAVDVYAVDNDPQGPATGINSASYNNSFFILQDGSVYGTGADNFGQLGRGGTTTGDYVSTPVKMQLPAGVTAKSVQSAYGTTVIVSTQGRVYTVGNNSNGQLGDGTTTNSSTPKSNTYTNMRSTIVY